MRPIALTLSLVTALLLFPPAAAASASTWRWPVQGRVITPYRNGPDPYAGGQHRGIDIAAPIGTPVVAAVGGTVTFAGLVGSSGLTVAVLTEDGRLETSYLHLSSIRVGAGDRVAAGVPLGAVGTTGRRSATEPHLHFGVRDAGSRYAYRDPLDFLPAPAPLSGPAPRPAPSPVGVPIARPAALVPALGEAMVAPRASATIAPLRGLTATVVAPLAAVAAPAAAIAANARVVAAPSAGPTAAPPVARGAGAVRAEVGHATARRGRIGRVAHVESLDAARARPTPGPGTTHAHGAPFPALGPAGHGAQPSRPNAGASSVTSELVKQSTTAHPPAHHQGGIDLGWLAACLAMVAAAALLGRPAVTAGSLRRAFQLPARVARSEEARGT